VIRSRPASDTEGDFTVGRIDKAGDFLRRHEAAVASGSLALRGPEHHDAVAILNRFRALHQLALTKVVMGVRSFMASEESDVEVAQRLKRQQRIVGKLIRFPHMRLSQMQDVGGCRAIFPDDAEPALRGVLRRIQSQWAVRRVDDYTATPQPTGYRAIHAIVMRDGRQIEIQLRTITQQHWADAVELLEDLTGSHLKDGEGPADVLHLLRIAADASALRAAGGTIPTQTSGEIERLTDIVVERYRGRISRQ